MRSIRNQNAADTATGEVTYEYNAATVTFENQSSDGQTVVVASVNLSEGGFVAVQNVSGARPDEIRGATAYLSAGTHENVEVPLDPALQENGTLVAQVYTDTNADRRFTYDEEGGEEDWPYRDRDGNVVATDDAKVTLDGGETATPTPTAVGHPTPTATPTPKKGADTPTETVTTTRADTTEEPTATPTATGGVPGFGPVVALVALLAAALLAARRG